MSDIIVENPRPVYAVKAHLDAALEAATNADSFATGGDPMYLPNVLTGILHGLIALVVIERIRLKRTQGANERVDAALERLVDMASSIGTLEPYPDPSGHVHDFQPMPDELQTIAGAVVKECAGCGLRLVDPIVVDDPGGKAGGALDPRPDAPAPGPPANLSNATPSQAGATDA